jgi:ABC-2 type transport system ATP-binding protein
LLDEVERVSDHVAMLHKGTLKLCAPLDDIRTQHRRLVLRFDLAHALAPNVPGALRVDGAGREWTVICDAARIYGPAMAQHLGATILEDGPASLDEIFAAHAAGAVGPSARMGAAN